MKMKLLFGLVTVSCLAFSVASAATPPSALGRILLQVEENGEAWYVTPSEERVYIRNGAAAYAALRTFGLGITDADLAKIPVGLEERFEDTDSDNDGLANKLEEALGTGVSDDDSDNDGYSDGTEVSGGFNPLGTGALSFDSALSERLEGYVVLQVESRGEAWYIHPVDGKRYYMKDGDAAYQIMRFLSLGITNADLATVPLLSTTLDCGDSWDCLIGAVETDVAAEATITVTLELFGIDVVTESRYTHVLKNAAGEYMFMNDTLNQTANGNVVEETIGLHNECTYTDKSQMSTVLQGWALGNASTDDLGFATCEYTE